MDEPHGETPSIEDLFERWQSGDDTARDRLLSVSCDRLRRLAHKMLHDYPGVVRWEETDDVLQNAIVRFLRALVVVKPVSVKSFFNLAAVQLRRELIDLARHYSGPHGMGAHHESVGPSDASGNPRFEAQASQTNEPSKLARWAEFHEQVGALPADQQEVFKLIWYGGLTQVQAGKMLKVEEHVVKRRWRAARLSLHRALGGELPA
jgi:RNA polymerase sigma factor (sigma-70 family)